MFDSSSDASVVPYVLRIVVVFLMPADRPDGELMVSAQISLDQDKKKINERKKKENKKLTKFQLIFRPKIMVSVFTIELP